MNEKNFEYLKTQTKFLGFGDAINDHLEKAILNNIPNFSIRLQSSAVSLAGHTPSFELFFNRSNKSDMYYFNSFKTSLADKQNINVSEQNFNVDHTKGITAKESINLLEGRSVKTIMNFKGEDHQVFLKINFDQKNDYGNYKFKTYRASSVDLSEIIDNSKIIKGDNDIKNLIKSLEKGNLASVKFKVDDDIIEGYVAIDAQKRILDYYNKDLDLLPIRDQIVKEKFALGEVTVNLIAKDPDQVRDLVTGSTDNRSLQRR